MTRVDGVETKEFKQNFNLNISSFEYQPDELTLIGIPDNTGYFQIDAINVMQPNINTGLFEKSKSSILILVQFRPCQIGEVYLKNQYLYECFICPEGKYSLVQPYKDQLQTCQQCPFDTSYSCHANQIYLKEGYWRKDKLTELILFCSNQKENCKGGNQINELSCYEGHNGALCEQCDIEGKVWGQSYARSTKYSCIKCSDIQNNTIFIIFSLIYTFSSIGLSIKSGIDEQKKSLKINKNFDNESLKKLPNRRLSAVILNVENKNIQNSNEGTVYIKILTNYLQIVSSISTFQLQFQTSYFDISNSVGQPISQTSNSLECFLQQYFGFMNVQMIYKRLILANSLSIIYFLAFILGYGLYSILRKQLFRMYIITTSFSFLVLFLQPDLVSNMISLLSCRTIGETQYILNNVSYLCNSDTYIIFSLSLVLPLLIVWSLGLPSLLLYLLYLNRDILNQEEIILKYGFLYKEYQNKHFYWEFIKMFQKILIIIFLNYYSQDVKVKGILTFVIIVIYYLLSIQKDPYKKQIITKTDTLSSKVCAITILTAVFISQIAYEYFFVLGVILILFVNIYFIFLLLQQIISSYSQALNQTINKLKYKIVTHFPVLKQYFQVNRKLIIDERWQQVRKFIKNLIQKQKDDKKQFKTNKNKDKQQIYPIVIDLQQQQITNEKCDDKQNSEKDPNSNQNLLLKTNNNIENQDQDNQNQDASKNIGLLNLNTPIIKIRSNQQDNKEEEEKNLDYINIKESSNMLTPSNQKSNQIYIQDSFIQEQIQDQQGTRINEQQQNEKEEIN